MGGASHGVLPFASSVTRSPGPPMPRDRVGTGGKETARHRGLEVTYGENTHPEFVRTGLAKCCEQVPGVKQQTVKSMDVVKTNIA